jgi:uncharacterized membrane protein
MLLLVIGLVIFFAAHLLPAQVEFRSALRARFGAKPYELGFIIVSFVGLALIGYAYARLQGLPGKNPVLWVPPTWTRHLLWLLMLPAFILLAAAYVPSRIRDAVGHPMLLSTKLWATGHLLANGRLAAVLLFGAFLTWAVIDLISVKKRGAKGPLGTRQGTLGGDAAAIGLGTVAYIFMLLWGHAWLIGVPVANFSFAP